MEKHAERKRAHRPEDFSWVAWEPEKIREVTDQTLENKREAYKRIKAIPGEERTWENTVFAVESSNYEADPLMNYVSILMHASPREEIREAAKSALEKFEKDIVDVEYDEELYRAVKEYASKQEALVGADKKLFDDMMRDYKRMGFELPKEKREALKRNIKELNQLGIDFSKNINDHEDHITVAREDLEGLPENYIERLKRDEAGRYRVTLKYPEFLPFMRNARKAEKRRELGAKFFRRGGPKNVELLKRMLELRRENARLLGYAHHADFVTEDRMAKNAQTVFAFLDGLRQGLKSGVEREMTELSSLKREMTGNPEERLEFYDISYYINEHKKRTFAVDDEKIREYFPLDQVIQGMLEIYSRIFSIRFEKLSGYPAWHPDVELFAIYESDGMPIAYFFLDLYPREGKYNHAAVFNLYSGRRVRSPDGETYLSPVCGMLANFPRPTAASPSLLSHDEVKVFFHEFGHVMHTTLTRAPYVSQSGTSVAHDFGEAPSQMLEHWVWEEDPIRMMSRHYETGDPLPQELLKSLLQAKRHMIAYDTMRQLTFGLFDRFIHIEDHPDVITAYNRLVEELIGYSMPEDNLFAAGFGHLVGYDAGYYGYLWSKVYSVDMFSRFKKEGIFNPKTGREYRSWILEKGSSMEEIDIVRKFLGREPDSSAFLEEIGLGIRPDSRF